MKLLKKTIRNLHKTILIIVFSSMIICLFNVVMSKFIIYIVDGIVMKNEDLPHYLTMFFYDHTLFSKILVAVIFMVVIALVITLFNYIKSRQITNLRLGMNKNIKMLLLDHATYLEYSSYTGYENNQILQRVSSDSNSYVSYINDKIDLVLTTFFYTLFSLNVIIELNFKVCLVLAIIIMIIIFMSIWYCINTKEIVSKKVTLSEAMIKKTMNAIYHPKMIKITNNQQNEINQFNQTCDQYLKYDLKEIDYLIYYELIAGGLKALSNPIIYFICGIMIIEGEMKIGSLMAIITYTTTMLNYLQNLVYAVEGINSFLVPAKKIGDYLSLVKEDIPKKHLVTNDYKKIRFKDVTVKFQNQIVLKNLNFEINKGENIYLVGPNGCGKSVIAKLLLGFIEYEGSIKIDKMELRDLHKGRLRENIGLCFQEPYIFSDTIKNNIDCFQKKDMKKIKKVSSICQLSEEIERLECKYDELLGERGINLSGGQKQRLNIARLLMDDKKVLIFDDVLSKLDNHTKEELIYLLNREYPDNINIFITHDLLRIPNQARVLFIDRNTLINSTGKELKKKNKHYRQLIDICENSVGGFYE